MRVLVMAFCGFFALYACNNDNQGSVVGGTSVTGIPVGGTSAGGISATGASGLGTSAAGGSGATTSNAGISGTTTSNNGGKAGAVTSNSGGKSGAGVSGSGTSGTGAGGSGGGAAKKRLAVSADLANQSLSIVDLAKMTEGAKREDALVGKVDLSAYTPGPLDLGITPDGKTAIVSISAGWLSSFDASLTGNGTLLIVDLERKTVVKELNVGASPMGVAITKDGKHAFVGIYGTALHVENYILDVDIEKQTSQQISTGASYNEELAIDDTGTTGILSYGTAGDCVTFSVANPSSTMGNTAGTLLLDAGGVAFFPGTKVAFVVQAPTVLTTYSGGHSTIDASNPQTPVINEVVRVANSPKWYPVTAVPQRNSVAVPAITSGKLSLIEWKLDGKLATQVQEIPLGDSTAQIAYGAATDPDGRVLVSVPEDHNVIVVDLTTKKVFTVPWGMTKVGPTNIRVVP